MKHVVIFILALSMLVPAFAQEQELSRKEQKALQKQLKKEQEAEEAAQRSQIVELMVEHRKFVLEAERLTDNRGNSVEVSSMINFVACDSVKGVVQIGSNHYIGGNGVGGVTVEGPISNYKSAFNEKNGSYSVSFHIRSTIGMYDVRMSIFSEGRAEASVTSTWPGRLTYSGYLVPPGASKVFKGMSY